jgi:hypothetical protein
VEGRPHCHRHPGRRGVKRLFTSSDCRSSARRRCRCIWSGAGRGGGACRDRHGRVGASSSASQGRATPCLARGGGAGRAPCRGSCVQGRATGRGLLDIKDATRSMRVNRSQRAASCFPRSTPGCRPASPPTSRRRSTPERRRSPSASSVASRR